MPKNSLSGVRFSLGSNSRTIEIQTDEVLTLFEGVTIKAPSIAANEFGLWSLASVGNKGEIKYASLTTPKHILQARNGCVWNPKMKITQVGGKMSLYPFTVNGEICPDAFWDNSFEKIFGVGLAIRDLEGTPEGRAVMDMIMMKIFAAMHNGTYDVMYYGGHPQITTSDTNTYWTVEADEWADFIDQMEVNASGGVLTQLDALRDAGNDAHLAVSIAAGDVSGASYTGGSNDITYYFDQLKANAHGDLLTVWEDNPEDVILCCHPAEFDAYEDYLLTTYTTIPDAFLYFIKGQNGNMEAAPGVLKYKGSWVVSMYGWRRFDRIVGINNHRIVATARGVFGGAYDISDVPGQTGTGVGMRIDQRFGGGEGFMGKIYMLSDFKLGTEILDKNLIAMASRVVTP